MVSGEKVRCKSKLKSAIVGFKWIDSRIDKFTGSIKAFKSLSYQKTSLSGDFQPMWPFLSLSRFTDMYIVQMFGAYARRVRKNCNGKFQNMKI